MSEPPSRNPTDPKPAKSLLERLAALISPEPESRSELLDILQDAHARNLIDADSLAMIQGVFQVSELAARDIMVPRSQMYVIDITQPIEEWIHLVLETAHSRFPVVEGDLEKIEGILLSKDLLRYYVDVENKFDIHAMLRPATFIPESKRLNVLLREFRDKHHHMAIVVDEYGSVSGLLTIEDVLEQIVGEIEDEYDEDENEDHIIPLAPSIRGERWRVHALTELDYFNKTIGARLDESSVDTVGGLISNHLGRVPQKGENCQIGELYFEVLRADAHQLHAILVEKRNIPAMAEP